MITTKVMLQEIKQNSISTTKMNKQKLTIHHANLFNPNLQEIFKLAWNMASRSLATLRKINQHGHSITIIEIYRMKDASSAPKLIRTYIEYEELTDIVWFNVENFMTASKEQNLNFYSIERGIKIASKITDYGPITSMKYFHEELLLFTGTEYGHLVAYKVHPKGKTVEPLKKMVKVNGRIKALDISKTKSQVLPSNVVKPSSSKIIPGKRKRGDSDDDEEEDDVSEEKINSLDTLDITIYGACDNNIVAWNYQKKTIIEMMNVCDKTEHVTALLALRSGDIVAGDSTGSINIFDHKTFTCRQTIKLLESAILCIVKNEKESCILVSGQDPCVYTLSKKTSNDDDLVLFEKIQFQAHKVSSIAYVGSTDYITGGDDGILVKVEFKRGQKELNRFRVPPNYVDKIKCCKKELMFQYDKSLVVWKLKKNFHKYPNTMPTKHLLLKTKDFIQASTISFEYISYSTKKGLYIVDRKAERLKPFRQIKWNAGGAQGCNVLKFCSKGQYLVYATMKILTIVGLIKGIMPKVEIHLKSPIKQIIELKQYPDLVAIVCSKHFYLYQLSKHKLVTKLDLGNDEVLFAARDKKCANIYIYTFHDQLAKIKIIDNANVALEKTGKTIEGLPHNANMLGMLCFPNNHCILFEPDRMFKVDLVANKVVNVNTNYKYILKMDFLFNNSEHVSLVELRPDYYTHLLPSVVTKKFGNK